MPPTPTRALPRTDLAQYYPPPNQKNPHPVFANGFITTKNPPAPYANAFSTMTREKEGTDTIKCEKRLKKVLQLCEECVKI